MDNLISIKELAKHLDISVKALRIRVSKGKIVQPVKREGDVLFWDRSVFGDTAAQDIDSAILAQRWHENFDPALPTEPPVFIEPTRSVGLSEKQAQGRVNREPVEVEVYELDLKGLNAVVARQTTDQIITTQANAQPEGRPVLTLAKARDPHRKSTVRYLGNRRQFRRDAQ